MAQFSSLPFYSFSLFFSLFFRCSHGVVVLLVLRFSSLGSQEWRLLQLSPVGIWNRSFSAAGLHITISQNGPRCKPTRTAVLSFSVENDRHQRRRLCSSSVRIRRTGKLSKHLTNQYAFDGRIWIPEWGSFVTCARACMHVPFGRSGAFVRSGLARGDGGQACLRRAKDLCQRIGGRDEC